MENMDMSRRTETKRNIRIGRKQEKKKKKTVRGKGRGTDTRER